MTQMEKTHIFLYSENAKINLKKMERYLNSNDLKTAKVCLAIIKNHVREIEKIMD